MSNKKIIAMVIGMMMLTNLGGCTQTTENNPQKSEKADIKGLVAKANNPQGIKFEDFDGKRSIRESNPVDMDYLKALQSFSVQSTAQILTNGERTSNRMYSPISLYMALALSASGAGHETQAEILSVLGMKELGITQLEEQTGNLYRLLYTDNEIGKLRLANSLWLDQDFSFKKGYIDRVKDHYYASLFSVDFNEKETSELISRWISENSNGTLKSTSPTSSEKMMAIINTVYFYDEWIHRFAEKQTKKDSFYLYEGDTISCDFMNMTFASHNFMVGEGYIASSLGFKNQGAMNFYLPDKGVDVYELISTPEKVHRLLGQNNEEDVWKNGKVVFKIPKFNFGANLELKEALRDLGIERAFKEDADFSGMTDEPIAYISDVMQATHISIDEKGCEASSYTEIGYVGSAMPEDEAEMILDRPFIFTITSANGVILFVGIVNDPTIK